MEVEDPDNDHQQITKINALLRSHYQVDPEALSNKAWAKLYQEYAYVKAVEYKNLLQVTELATKKALAEILGQVFSK
ncbi:hypothetical protein [Formosa sp. A9]|uniref:hypothetical protein n=1 Tax=Formosa sp. A9 TaxID=3442641 RepID=UPI003EB9AC3B